MDSKAGQQSAGGLCLDVDLFPLFAVKRRARLLSKFLVTIHAKLRVWRQSLCSFFAMPRKDSSRDRTAEEAKRKRRRF
jgi:hypothetical protein